MAVVVAGGEFGKEPGVESGEAAVGVGVEDVLVDDFRMVVVCESAGRDRLRYLWRVAGRGSDIGRRKGRGSVDDIVEVRSRGID